MILRTACHKLTRLSMMRPQVPRVLVAPMHVIKMPDIMDAKVSHLSLMIGH